MTAIVLIAVRTATASAAVEDIRLPPGTAVSKGGIAESYDAFGPATEYDRAEASQLRYDLKAGDWLDPFADWQIPATVQGYAPDVSSVRVDCSIGASAGVRCNVPDDLLLAEMEYLDATGDESDQKEQEKLKTESSTTSSTGPSSGSNIGLNIGEDPTTSAGLPGMASGVSSPSSQGMETQQSQPLTPGPPPAHSCSQHSAAARCSTSRTRAV
jgi:hypothetical protein